MLKREECTFNLEINADCDWVIIAHWRSINFNAKTAIDAEGHERRPCFWPDYAKEMASYSKTRPGLLFKMTVMTEYGEQKTFAMNGHYKTVTPTVTYPDMATTIAEWAEKPATSVSQSERMAFMLRGCYDAPNMPDKAWIDMQSLVDYVDSHETGDTLFDFIVHEIGEDDIKPSEVIKRLEKAKLDLEDVIVGLEPLASMEDKY